MSMARLKRTAVLIHMLKEWDSVDDDELIEHLSWLHALHTAALENGGDVADFLKAAPPPVEPKPARGKASK